MKLNLGCGFNKQDGFLNVDKFNTCNPDLVMDMEVTPWEFNTDDVDEVLLNHCLEHIGQDVDVFFAVMKELYRVCKHGAKIQINVPHPRHDFFITDPTHVRIITPDVLSLFSKKNCNEWVKAGRANSPLALYLDVDFEVKRTRMVVEKKYLDLLSEKKMTQQELQDIAKSQNNVIKEYRITVEVIKTPPN
jgi:hypothetical protein